MSDRYLSERAGVPLSTVFAWRESRSVKPNNRASKALDIFKDGGYAAIHLAKSSIVAGEWKPPVYLKKTALDYDQFAKMCWFLLQQSTMSEGDIASATGVAAHDVQVASRLYTRYLAENAGTCKTCGRVSLGRYCSVKCGAS